MVSSTHRCGNLLDLVFVNDEKLISEVKIAPAPVRSDHACLLFNVHAPAKDSSELSPSLDFANADHEAIVDGLLRLPCETVAANFEIDIDAFYGYFPDTVG